MLFVLLQLDKDRYAIDTTQVVEILPLLNLKGIPQAPKGIAGVMDYRGSIVPVVDLSELAIHRPAAKLLSTRILIVQDDQDQNLGLMAERANEMMRRDPSDFVDAGVTIEAAPYLGPVTRDSHGVVQWITPGKLLTPEVREALFRQTAQAA